MSTSNDQNNCDVHLHAEIEALKQALVEKQNQLISMETACLRESDRQAELEDSIIAWQDKYDRLYESHKRVQKVNQSLEDKLLKLVDRNSAERAQLTSDVATLSVRLAQANYNIAKLQSEIERYKTDINLAIQLLQCKPDSFVPQKVSSLPIDIQSKVSSYMKLETNSHSDSEGSTSGVGVATSGSYKVLPASDSPPPICPFPPTAMVYSMRGLDAQNSECTDSPEQLISPSIIAKYLEDELKSSEIKHCDTCKCSNKDLTVLADELKTYSIGTQTIIQGENNSSLCLRCNSNLNSPSRTNSPYIMKLVKSSDSVISETKSSVSDFNDADKLFTPAKKDDLMVNPILGHHRLCDRTTTSNRQLIKQSSAISVSLNSNIVSNKYSTENERNCRKNDENDRDLIDLNKFNNNNSNNGNINTKTITNVNMSMNVNVSGASNNNNLIAVDITSSNTFSRNQSMSDINGKSLMNTSRKSDSSNLLIDSIEGSSSSNVQGNLKSDIILGIDDKKLESSGGSQNLQTSATGSTNSLWSKTSSTEGAKIFENFNRNLIKTIKSENPKYQGPRLCALRIQNGTNNILLDGIESEITPILYTRRQRFLDEELDDTKDVITSKMSTELDIISDMNSNSKEILKPNTEEYSIEGNIENKLGQQEQQNNSNILNSSVMVMNGQRQNQSDLNIMDGNLTNLISNSNNFLDQLHFNGMNAAVNEIYQQQEQQKQQQKQQNQSLSPGTQNYDMMTLCDNSINSSCPNTNSKSCTQSSSISSADVDLQENFLLRRQQLTRVAEWVQNNSNIEQTKILSNNNSSCVNNGLSNTDSNLRIPSLNNASSIEILSGELNGKIKSKQFPNGFCSNSTNSDSKKTINQLQPHDHQKYSQLANVSKYMKNSQIPLHVNNEEIAQNNLITDKINLTKMQRQHEEQQEDGSSSNENRNCSYGSQQVDLAQMEYNVKQFLLKQNEWSMKNKVTTPSVTVTSTINCNNPVATNTVKCHPHRTETNL